MSEHGGVGGTSLAGLDRLLADHGGQGIRAAAPDAGGVLALNADRAVRAVEPLMAAPMVADVANFRNFGLTGRADDQDIYAGFGTARAWDTQVMFAKLMLRMAGAHRLPNGTIANTANPYRFPDGTVADNANNFNHAIPAGYTYLAQFAAHDIIRNSALAASLASTKQGNRNLRQRSLMLDTLYGDGPVFDESAFELPKDGEGFRTMLRTGPIATLAGATCPYRDIPRFQQSDLSDYAVKPAKPGRPDILIPDERNDDNAIVAQVTALFHHIHNAVVTALRALPDMPTFDQEGPRGLHLFENARRVTSALYRRVIRDDLLSKLVIKPIWERYLANGFAPLADPHSDGIPREFSHAAFRLGHSMVRMSYVFNDEHAQGEGIRDVLRTRSAVRPHKFPPATNWIAEWSRFFEIKQRPEPQPSRRIGPCFNDVLLDDGVFSNPLVRPPGAGPLSAEDSAKLPDRHHSGLLLRDLIRGTIGGLLTLDAILRTIPQDVLSESPLLADPAQRAQALRSWLSGSEVVFSDTELDHLSTNPPLILWLLFEAAEEANGCSLGTLGSIIVADVFVAQLAASHDEIEADPRTAALLALLFPLPEKAPADMPALILFTAKVLDLENVVPPFVSPPSN